MAHRTEKRSNESTKDFFLVDISSSSGKAEDCFQHHNSDLPNI
jgi:hypothetical protein